MGNEDEGAKLYHGRPMLLDYRCIKHRSRKGIAVSLFTREFLSASLIPLLIDVDRPLLWFIYEQALVYLISRRRSEYFINLFVAYRCYR